MNSKIMVIGDPMIDIHLTCNSDRLSPEAPVPICLLQTEHRALGGSANVAAQIAVMQPCIMAHIYSRHSSELDYAFSRFQSMCVIKNVELLSLLTTRCYKIPKKTRIWANKQQVCRIDDELQHVNFTEKVNKQWLTQIENCIKDNNIRLIILSDYDKGMFNDVFLQQIIDMAHSLNVITILDPKRPTYSTLRNLSIVTPNDAEMEKTILTPSELSKNMHNTYLVHTMGARGMNCYKNGELLTHVAAHEVDVFDTCGCGDTVIAFIALMLNKLQYNLNDNTIKTAMITASFAASRTVMHRGSYILSLEEAQSVFGLIK